jgi:hypothetical protein
MTGVSHTSFIVKDEGHAFLLLHSLDKLKWLLNDRNKESKEEGAINKDYNFFEYCLFVILKSKRIFLLSIIHCFFLNHYQN